MNTAIQVSELTKTFKDQIILDRVSLTVKPGEIYAFLGANGAGKTTLMKLLFGILKPDSGVISVLGRPVSTTVENLAFSKIGNIIETPVFYKNLSAADNLRIHCDYINPGVTQEIPELLKLVGLYEAANQKTGEFSLGMKQRLALARALIGKPRLLVLDEPINGLDPIGITDTRHLLLSVNKELGTAMLISSHIISEVAKIADTVGIIDHGVMLAETPMEKISSANADLETYFTNIVMKGKSYA